MKVQIIHDRSGAVLAAFARTGGERMGSLEPLDDSQSLLEVDAEDVNLSEADVRDGKPSRSLADVVDQYQVRDGRVVRRSADAS